MFLLRTSRVVPIYFLVCMTLHSHTNGDRLFDLVPFNVIFGVYERNRHFSLTFWLCSLCHEALCALMCKNTGITVWITPPTPAPADSVVTLPKNQKRNEWIIRAVLERSGSQRSLPPKENSNRYPSPAPWKLQIRLSPHPPVTVPSKNRVLMVGPERINRRFSSVWYPLGNLYGN